MGRWNRIDTEHEYTTDDGTFIIVEGQYDGYDRLGVRWRRWPACPVVIPPEFENYIWDIINQETEDDDYDDDDDDDDD